MNEIFEFFFSLRTFGSFFVRALLCKIESSQKDSFTGNIHVIQVRNYQNSFTCKFSVVKSESLLGDYISPQFIIFVVKIQMFSYILNIFPTVFFIPIIFVLRILELETGCYFMFHFSSFLSLSLVTCCWRGKVDRACSLALFDFLRCEMRFFICWNSFLIRGSEFIQFVRKSEHDTRWIYRSSESHRMYPTVAQNKFSMIRDRVFFCRIELKLACEIIASSWRASTHVARLEEFINFISHKFTWVWAIHMFFYASIYTIFGVFSEWELIFSGFSYS